jgi:outer membrane receptor protein involved in Fe transport
LHEVNTNESTSASPCKMSRIPTVALLLAVATPVVAQTSDNRPASLDTVVVTATRSERSAFDAPQPVTVLDSRLFRQRLPNGIADLFRDFPGLDASGVGPNQRRPEIRGMRGQRILLLQDGLRLNNSRRQQDFGEIPAVAGTDFDRVEVVRGPSSVLYGSDAIGGVVNIISRDPRLQQQPVSGALTYRYGSNGLNAPSGNLSTRIGRFALRAGAAFRDAEPYRAPAGSFGDITLEERERVYDSGIRDESYDIASSFDVSRYSQVFARAGWYEASDAGFGFIDPAALGQGQPRIQIRYPDQSYARQSLGFRSSALSTFFANRMEITGYAQQNERTLQNLIFVPAGPNASIDTKTYNFSDLSTVGGRLELARALGQATIFTYGADAFRDRSENTDSSRTVITGFGPTITRTSNVPQIPNATFTSAGVFAQLEAQPIKRLSTVLGARYQTVSAKTRETTGIDRDLIEGDDQTVVWSANGVYRAASNLNIVASLGRGFRAANLVERFFEGLAPEGNGYQRSNPNLESETSLNGDLGLRFQSGPFHAQGFVFRNDISNAIRIEATGDSVSGRPAFRNQNIDKLRVKGAELTGGVATTTGFDASISYTRLDGSNISDPDSPIGDSYSSKVVGDLGYRVPGGRFSLGYTIRYQGEQKDVIIGENPIGDVIPSFVVHSARATAILFKTRGITNELALNVENLGNKLYAEFPNASFFRPEAERNVSLAMVVRF